MSLENKIGERKEREGVSSTKSLNALFAASLGQLHKHTQRERERERERERAREREREIDR